MQLLTGFVVQGHIELEDINLCFHYYDYNFIKGFLSVFSMFNLNQRDMRRPGEQREEHIGRVLGNVAPSMLLCSLSESVCFFLGKNLPLILNSVSPHKTEKTKFDTIMDRNEEHLLYCLTFTHLCMSRYQICTTLIKE